jgi:hypothetical protein
LVNTLELGQTHDGDFVLLVVIETIPVTIEEKRRARSVWLVDVHTSLNSEEVPVEVDPGALFTTTSAKLDDVFFW